MAAKWRGVLLSSSAISGLAPCFRRSYRISCLELWRAALRSGVLFYGSTWFTSAFATINLSHIAKFSYMQAKVKAVSPLAFVTLGSAPNLKSNSTILKWPLIDAFMRLVVCELSTQSISKASAPLSFIYSGVCSYPLSIIACYIFIFFAALIFSLLQ